MLVVELESLLAAHPFLNGFDRRHVRVIARCGRLCTFRAGDYLWRQGDIQKEAFVVLEGEIAVEIAVPNEGNVLIETIREGEVAGCTCLLKSARWRFDARTTQDGRAIVLNARKLRAAMEQDHELGYQVLERCAKALGKRLNASRLKLVEAHNAALP